MKRIKISENFFLDEYIPKELYIASSDPAKLMDFISADLVGADELLRREFGPVIINNWWVGGFRNYSGYRPKDCKIGASKSDHKKGMASDKIFVDFPAEHVRKYIRGNWKQLGITKIEIDTSWVHSSVAHTGLDYLQQFKP